MLENPRKSTDPSDPWMNDGSYQTNFFSKLSSLIVHQCVTYAISTSISVPVKNRAQHKISCPQHHPISFHQWSLSLINSATALNVKSHLDQYSLNAETIWTSFASKASQVVSLVLQRHAQMRIDLCERKMLSTAKVYAFAISRSLSFSANRKESDVQHLSLLLVSLIIQMLLLWNRNVTMQVFKTTILILSLTEQ